MRPVRLRRLIVLGRTYSALILAIMTMRGAKRYFKEQEKSGGKKKRKKKREVDEKSEERTWRGKRGEREREGERSCEGD